MRNNPCAAPKESTSKGGSLAKLPYSRRSRLVCTAGLLLFVMSLALPAIKYGKTTYGVECLMFSVMAFFPAPPSAATASTGSQMVWMSRAVMVAHASCFAIATSILLQIQLNRFAAYTLTAATLLVCLVFLLPTGYGAESRYVGYYAWLTSLALTSLSIHVNDIWEIWLSSRTQE